MPLKHKIDFIPISLPESLQAAIRCFVIAKAIRLVRGHMGEFHSMMVNASRFTKVQNFLTGLVYEYVKQMKESIANYSSLPSETALQNEDLRKLNSEFKKEFTKSETTWNQVQAKLRDAADPIEVVTVNSSSREALSYDRDDYPKGRTVIPQVSSWRQSRASKIIQNASSRLQSRSFNILNGSGFRRMHALTFSCGQSAESVLTILSNARLSSRVMKLSDKSVADIPATYEIWDFERIFRAERREGHAKTLRSTFAITRKGASRV